jgi:hypothetical protein
MTPLIRRACWSRPVPASATQAGAGRGRPPAEQAAAKRAAGRRAAGPLCALLAVGLAGCAAAAAHPAAQHPAARHSASGIHFGGYASYLPRDTLHYRNDTTLTGTVQRPALTSEGDAVIVKTPAWSVLVTVTGPQVPGEGLPYQAPTTTCTWVVTMSGATGPVPVSAADFSSIDDLGNVYRPAFVAGQPTPPKVLRPGMKVSFELRVVEATGEGLMRWAPDGTHIVAKWDFVVEND